MTKPPKPDSIFKEAWDNMSDDLARLLPASLAGKPGGRRRGWKVVLAVTVLELLLLGVVGKLLYSWLAG